MDRGGGTLKCPGCVAYATTFPYPAVGLQAAALSRLVTKSFRLRLQFNQRLKRRRTRSRKGQPDHQQGQPYPVESSFRKKPRQLTLAVARGHFCGSFLVICDLLRTGRPAENAAPLRNQRKPVSVSKSKRQHLFRQSAFKPHHFACQSLPGLCPEYLPKSAFMKKVRRPK